MKKYITILFLFTCFFSHAQEVADFTLKNAQNGKEISLSDFKKNKGVVIIFTSNICPYAVYYEGRITQLISEYQKKGIPFILINSHKESKESEAEMANKIKTWGLNTPYLADKEQKALSLLGAKKSPEAFLLKNQNGQFSIYYKGAIDNNPQVASDVKNQFLRENLERLLNDEPPVAGGRSIGCMIKQN